MGILTILGVMRVLCSLRVVLEGKEIPESLRLELFDKFLVNNFVLSDAEDNTSGPLNRGVRADLPLLKTLLAIRHKSPESQVSGKGYTLLFYSKFGSSKNLFAMITSLPELYFRFGRFTLLVQTKRVISMNYDSSRSS